VESEIYNDDALSFWKQQRRVYGELIDIIENLSSSPSPHAYIVCVFSVCGLLTQEKNEKVAAEEASVS